MLPYSVVATHHQLAVDTLGRVNGNALDTAERLVALWIGAGREALDRDGASSWEVASELRQRAFRESTHALASAYATWVQVVGAGWHGMHENLQRAVLDLERHLPGGTEFAVEAARKIADAVERSAEDIAASTVAVADAADRGVRQAADAPPARRPAARRRVRS